MNYFVVINKRYDDIEFAYGEKLKKYNQGEAVYCVKCQRPVSMLEWLPPFKINVSKKKIGDAVFGTITGMVVSDKFKNLFIDNGLTGLFDFRKVEVFFRKKMISNKYYYPRFQKIYNKIEYQDFLFEKYDPCDVCIKGGNRIRRMNGINIKDKSSIEYDIFFMSALGQADLIVSERFKIMVEENCLTNFQFIEAEKFKDDIYDPYYT